MGWLKVILAIPDIMRAIKALIDFVNEQKEQKRVNDLNKLKEDMKNAQTEEDYRRNARKL